MTEPVSNKVAASLPPHVRRRYAMELESMERYEKLIDAAVDAVRHVRRALGKSCLAAARLLDHAAQRLLLIR